MSRPDYPLTEEACVENGGHCYQGADYMLASNPPQSVRICKHCGKSQRGIMQDSYRWVDA